MQLFSTAYAAINHLYYDVLFELMGDNAYLSAPRDIPIYELLGQTVRLLDARDCVVTLPARKLNYHFMVAEWWWIASGDDRVVSISHYNSQIAQFSDDGARFAGAYGPPWTAQLDYVLAKLREDPESRQAVVTIWRPSPAPSKDIPCTVAMQYLLRDGYLHALVTMRSSDAWLGLPYDLFNFARLQAIVAGELGAQIGFLQLQAGSLHLYERNLEQARRVVQGGFARVPNYSLESLPGRLPRDAHLLEEMARRDGTLGTEIEPWRTYLEVLADRKNKKPGWVSDGQWRELLYPGYEP